MKTHLVRWQKEHAKKGLVIIDIDDGSMDTRAAVEASVKSGGIKYPVLWDKAEKNTRTYGVRGMPSAFLVGVDGRVIWEGVPVRKIREIQKLIKAELKKVKSRGK